jgi:signal transduction histidine kinase
VEDSLAAAQDLVAHRLQATGATIIADIPPDLPSLHADPGQLIHLLANLLANAAAALEGTGRSPRILMAAVAEENTMVLRVADNGPGIAPPLRERVFQPFFTTKPEGTGVGLALCRTIVQDHGGSITAEDTPGGGATLVVRLPLPMP